MPWVTTTPATSLRFEVVRHALGEAAPDGVANVLAVDLGHLLGLQIDPGQSRDAGQQLGDADLRRR